MNKPKGSYICLCEQCLEDGEMTPVFEPGDICDECGGNTVVFFVEWKPEQDTKETK